MYKKRRVGRILPLVLALVMAVSCLPMSGRAASSREIQEQIDALEEKNAAIQNSCLPMSGRAASSREIQEQIDALEEKNAAIQNEINAIQGQYNANFKDMQDMVAQKESIDQELTLLNSKVETTNQQISAYSQLIADTHGGPERVH